MTRKLLNVRCCSHRHWMSTTFLLLLFNSSVTFNSLLPHGLQDIRFPCLLPTSGACSNSCPLSCWRYPIIWPSVIPFSSCLQSFPSSRSFLRSRFFASWELVMDREASSAAIHGVTKSRTRLSDWTELNCYIGFSHATMICTSPTHKPPKMEFNKYLWIHSYF